MAGFWIQAGIPEEDRLQAVDGRLAALAGNLEAEAKAAFKEQRFRTRAWPALYPDQRPKFTLVQKVGRLLKLKNPFSPPPKVNVARLLTVLARGGTEADFDSAGVFKDRPALHETGALEQSIKSNYTRSGDMVIIEIGSDLPYASKHQEGGKSDEGIPITKSMQETLKKILKSRPEYKSSMEWILQASDYNPEVYARPFIPTPDELEESVAKALEG